MSQSRAAKGIQPHSADLKYLDIIYAVVLHGLILIIIAVVAFWQQEHKHEPLKRIEVMMISAKALAKLEQQAHHNIKAPKTKPAKSKPTKVKKKKHKPVKSKPHKLKPKPVIKTKPVKKQAAKVDDNFDPFAPVSSSTDVKSPPKKAHTSRPELANLAGKQLSRSEKERYIALMQAAVQQHWKIAVSSTKFTDPLVEMKLLPSGAIASVRILESSGNASLDASLIRAIKAAAPFALPRRQFEFFRTNRIRFHPLK